MSVIIRTRKNGQRYPITPKSSFASHRPNFSPTQIWQKFLQSQSPEDRLRLKRAAVSVANRAQSQGNTEIAAEYRKIVNKMTESETTKYDRTKSPEWQNTINQMNTPKIKWMIEEYQSNINMQPREKRDSVKIVWMPPQEFLDRAPHRNTMRKESIDNITALVNKGERLYVPYLDYSKPPVEGYGIAHEGRHRATVAKAIGEKEIPVMIVAKNPEQLNEIISSITHKKLSKPKIQQIRTTVPNGIKLTQQKNNKEIAHISGVLYEAGEVTPFAGKTKVPMATIQNIDVSSTDQRQGNGTALVNEYEKVVKAKGAKKILVEYVVDEAVPWWEKRGYTKVGRRTYEKNIG